MNVYQTRADDMQLINTQINSHVYNTGKQHIPLNLSNIHRENEEVVVLANGVARSKIEQKMKNSKWFPQIDFEIQAGYEPLLDRPSQGGHQQGG